MIPLLARFRLTRLDLLLLLALLVTSGVIWGLSRDVKTSRPALPKEESLLREKIKTTLTLNRQTLEKRIREDRFLLIRLQLASWAILILMAGSFLCLMRVAFRALSGRPLYLPLGAPSPPTWGFGKIIRLVLILVVISQASIILMWALKLNFGFKWLDRRTASLVNTLLMDGMVILFTWRILSWSRSLKGTRFAFASYLTFLPFLGLLVTLVALGMNLLKVEPRPQPVLAMYMAETRTPVVLWFLILATIAGPIAEEIFFRGLLYGWLRVRIGVGRALGLSSLLFACLHADAIAFLPIFGLGLLFGWVYEQTGSLSAPMAIHVLHNGGMLYFASLVKSLLALS